MYLDLCWPHLISPVAGARLLQEAIQTVPANKIFAFGGDFIIPVETYGHSVMARRRVGRSLTGMVEEGDLSEGEALGLARRVLRDNPATFFRLKVEAAGDQLPTKGGDACSASAPSGRP